MSMADVYKFTNPIVIGNGCTFIVCATEVPVTIEMAMLIVCVYGCHHNDTSPVNMMSSGKFNISFGM